MALEKEMRRNLIAPPQEEREKFIADIATRQKYNTVDDFTPLLAMAVYRWKRSCRVSRMILSAYTASQNRP